jgi:hypothetical protein
MQRDIESGSISIESLKSSASSCEKKLNQVFEILQSETSGSYLSTIAAKAKKDIARVQELIRFADYL